MKKKILVLGMVLALVAAMVMPMAVLAEDTTVTGTVATTVVTITPPSAVALGALPYNASDAWQVVGEPTSQVGGVSVADLRGRSYLLTVTGVPQVLTSSSATDALAVALMIATGDAAEALGAVATAAAVVTAGNKIWATGDEAGFVTLDGTAQQIGTGITTDTAGLDLYVLQKINAAENPKAGTDYTLTLTYASTVTE